MACLRNASIVRRVWCSANVNYVKKVVFPLEILPWTSLVAALFHTAISVLGVVSGGVDVNASCAVDNSITAGGMVAVCGVGIMGISWFLASIGVYLRDVAQITGLVTTVLLFMSPVFYPLSALPEKYQVMLLLESADFYY